MPPATLSSQRLQSLNPQWCAELHDWFQCLLDGSPVQADALRHLIRQLLLDVCEIQQPRRLLEWIFADIGSSFPTQVSDVEKRVSIVGIQTARLISWSAGHMPAWRQQLDVLAMSAVLQDCGFLVLNEHRCDGAIARHANHHPTIGRALLAGMRDCSMQIPIIVGQHHERSDGLGRPQQLPHRELLPASRYLAIAVRFWETACSLMDAGSPAPTRFTRAIQDSAGQLHREAECGAFDLALTTLFLEQLELLPGSSSPLRRQVAGRLIRTDMQHCWHGPHRRPASQALHEQAEAAAQ